MPRTHGLQVFAPAPTATHRLEDPERADEARHLDCRAYDRCLAGAAAQGWRSFHCRGCAAYVAQTPGERYRDLLGLLQLLAEVQLPAAVEAPRSPARAGGGLFLRDLDDTMPLPLAAATRR